MGRKIRIGYGGYTIVATSQYLMVWGVLLIAFAAAPIRVTVKDDLGKGSATEFVWPHTALKGDSVLGLTGERDVLAARGLLILAAATGVIGILASLCTRAAAPKYFLDFVLGGAAVAALVVLHDRLPSLSRHFDTPLVPTSIGLLGFLVACIGAGLRIRCPGALLPPLLSLAGAAGLSWYLLRAEPAGLDGSKTTVIETAFRMMKESDWYLTFLPRAALIAVAGFSLLSLAPGRAGRIFSVFALIGAVIWLIAVPGAGAWNIVSGAGRKAELVELAGWYGRVIGLVVVFAMGTIGLLRIVLRRTRRVLVGGDALSYDHFRQKLEEVHSAAGKGIIGSERLNSEKRELFVRIEKHGTLEPREEFYKLAKSLVDDGLLKSEQYRHLGEILRLR